MANPQGRQATRVSTGDEVFSGCQGSLTLMMGAETVSETLHYNSVLHV